jgi:hypothetical protein
MADEGEEMVDATLSGRPEGDRARRTVKRWPAADATPRGRASGGHDDHG